ncbi:MAG: VanZ family protein [Bacteroidia bacterium]|nr:VanZ family protein [Bacteroidia bacterium]
MKHQLPAIAWAIFILVLCTTSNAGFQVQTVFNIPTDKLGHAFIFAVLVYFIMLGLIKYWRFSFLLNKIRITALSIAIVYAAAIELIQHYFTNDRIGDYWDFLADIIGCLIGLIMFYSVYGNLKFLDK